MGELEVDIGVLKAEVKGLKERVGKIEDLLAAKNMQSVVTMASGLISMFGIIIMLLVTLAK